MGATMKAVILACAFALLALNASAAQPTDKFDPSRDAAQDVARAVAMAKAQGKRVIVDVGGEWCSWCHVLDRFVAANDDVAGLIARNYVWVKVNYSKENRNDAFLSRWPGIRGYPHLFVLDASGALVHSQDTGVLESGNGYDKARVLAFLTRWAVQGSRT
jgi:thiol:disulfide interchange protein